MSRFHRGEHIQHVVKMCNLWKQAAIFESFASSIYGPEKMKKETLDFFRTIDKDDSGYIDKDEIMDAFPQLDEMAAQGMLEEADTDHDQRISFEKFWAIIDTVVISM